MKKTSLIKEFEKIAKEHLFIETLKTQNRDCLDFHDVSVRGVVSALLAAYELGIEEGKRKC